jgi:hypothetical protein
MNASNDPENGINRSPLPQTGDIQRQRARKQMKTIKRTPGIAMPGLLGSAGEQTIVLFWDFDRAQHRCMSPFQ